MRKILSKEFFKQNCKGIEKSCYSLTNVVSKEGSTVIVDCLSEFCKRNAVQIPEAIPSIVNSEVMRKL